jgi:hypothetical protein
LWPLLVGERGHLAMRLPAARCHCCGRMRSFSSS